MSTFSDHIEKFKKAAYRNFITKRFRKNVTRKKKGDTFELTMPQLDFSFSNLYRKELPREAWVRVTLPMFGETARLSYKMPLALETIYKILDDTYFEVSTLDGKSMESALESMFNDEFSHYSQEDFDRIEEAFDNPPEPTEAALRAKNQTLALLNIIQEENDLTRYQAYYVFSRVFVSGGLSDPETSNGDIIEASMEKVREYLDEESVENYVRDLEPPSSFRRSAPMNIRKSRPGAQASGAPAEVRTFQNEDEAETDITFNGRKFTDVSEFLDFMSAQAQDSDNDLLSGLMPSNDQDTDG